MPTIKIHNAETQEVIEREMTEDEKRQYEVFVEQAKKEKELAEQAAAAKAALLEKLGITEDEAKLLLS